MPCSLVEIDWRFRDDYCLHLHFDHTLIDIIYVNCEEFRKFKKFSWVRVTKGLVRCVFSVDESVFKWHVSCVFRIIRMAVGCGMSCDVRCAEPIAWGCNVTLYGSTPCYEKMNERLFKFLSWKSIFERCSNIQTHLCSKLQNLRYTFLKSCSDGRLGLIWLSLANRIWNLKDSNYFTCTTDSLCMAIFTDIFAFICGVNYLN